MEIKNMNTTKTSLDVTSRSTYSSGCIFEDAEKLEQHRGDTPK